ncbi:MAG: hypothetical protein GWP08_09380 [Nitrospiraceae bacterium]|nr:hypothetical protein [Nitrospiraceae bacterium]
MDRKKTVLVVVAHADDMEFLAGGTVARFIDEKGYDVYEHILTDNSKGSFSLSPEELIEQSAREAVEAAETLGLKEVRLEGYPDGLLNETHPNVLREKIMAFIREVKADIVMSWDPFAPCEDHPDHRTVAMATFEAASFSAMPLYHPEHPDPPHMVTEAYWFAKCPWNAECFVDISSTIDKKLDALLKHETQMALTLEGLRREAEILGADASLFADQTAEGCRRIMEMGVRDFCAKKGAEAGIAAAEQFRYEKLGMLDMLLNTDLIKADF